MKTLKISYMKTSKIVTIMVIVLVAFSSCQFQEQKQQISDLSAQNEELTRQLSERDSLMSEMMATFTQVEEALNYIKGQSKILTNTEEASELSINNREQVVKDVEMMAEILKESRQKLSRLNKKLKESGVKIANLEEKISSLEAELTQSQTDILTLTSDLEAKNFEVSQLQEQIVEMAVVQEEQLAVIEDQKGEIDNLNVAYYVSGTSKELKEKGLIDKSGGFLGIGKTKTLSDDVETEYFSEFDIRYTDSIPVSASAAKLVTKHPAGSYEFVTQDGMVSYLEIKEPDEFYKFSKFIVMEVK